MDIFSIIQLLAWAVIAVLLFLFAATGGFDLGSGMLAPFVGKTDAERRVVINTVGPTWDGNQVWLITAGGAIFAIWPRVYAASFSGFYFAILLVLWSLFLRPVSFEYRSKIHNPKWRTFWDWALFAGSLLPALLIGVGIGDLFQGVPFQYDPISLRFFYGPHMQDSSAIIGLLGLLRPFALYSGVLCVVLLLMHGASYLVMRTHGVVLDRCRKVVKIMAILFIVLFAVGGVWLAFGINGYHYTYTADPMLHPLTSHVTRGVGFWMHNYQTYPAMFIAPILGFLGAIGVLMWSGGQHVVRSFIASTVAVLGVIFSLALTLFPFIMPSSLAPSQSLIVWNATSSELSLIGILVVAVIMLPIIFYYTNFVYRKMWGRGHKMSVEQIQKEENLLY